MDFLWTEIKNCQKCHFRPHIDFQKWPSGLFLRIFDQNLPCLALDLTPLLDNFFRQCENFSDLREFFSNWREIFHRREFFQTCRNNVSTCHSDSAGPTWTKIGTVKQIDPGNKPLAAFLKKMQIDPTPEGQSSKFQKKFWGQKIFLTFFFFFEFWRFFSTFLKKKIFLVRGGAKKILGSKNFFNFFFFNFFFYYHNNHTLLSEQPPRGTFCSPRAHTLNSKSPLCD